MGSMGILGQLSFGASTGVGTGTVAAATAAEDTKPVAVCRGRTRADDQVNGGGLTVEGGVSTSGADEDMGIDCGTAAWSAEASVAFVGKAQTDFAGGGAVPALESAFFAVSAAAAAPNPFHVPVEGVEDPTGLLDGKDCSTSGAHLKPGSVATGAEAMDTGISPGLEIEVNESGAGVNDWFNLGNGDTGEARSFSLLRDAGVPYSSRGLRCLVVEDAIS